MRFSFTHPTATRTGRRLLNTATTFATLCASLLVAGGAAHAQVIVGGTGTGNAFPFSQAYTGTYQQIYASSAFPGPVTITQIAFVSVDNPGTFSFTETLSLGTTGATPAAPGNDYAANRRPDLTTVFSGTINPTLAGDGSAFDLIFDLTTPFVYNPALGDLLLEVNTGPTDYSGFFEWGDGTPDSGRVYNTFGNGAATAGPNESLRTRFLFATAAPEPATLGLLAPALGGAFAVARRRRK